MTPRGRPEKLTDELKRWILQYAKVKEPKRLKEPEVRGALVAYLRDRFIKEKIPPTQLDIAVEDKLPGVTSLQLYLKNTVYPNLDKSPEADQPWHLGLLRNPEYHDITAQTLPYLFKVQEWTERNKQPNLTARQAWWISRLCGCWPEIRKMRDKELKSLWFASRRYAEWEIVCELSDTDLKTPGLDDAMWYGGWVKVVEALWGAHVEFGKEINDRLNGVKEYQQ